MWNSGDKTELARRVGISPQYLSNIINRRTRCKAELALRLERACQEMRLMIPKESWAFNLETDNPYFSEKRG